MSTMKVHEDSPIVRPHGRLKLAVRVWHWRLSAARFCSEAFRSSLNFPIGDDNEADSQDEQTLEGQTGGMHSEACTSGEVETISTFQRCEQVFGRGYLDREETYAPFFGFGFF
jgi:hypothetical protein